MTYVDDWFSGYIPPKLSKEGLPNLPKQTNLANPYEKSSFVYGYTENDMINYAREAIEQYKTSK